MQNIKIEGVGTISGGDYEMVRVDGVGKCEGNLQAQSIDINGTFKCLGAVKTDLFDCDGATELRANLFAKKIIVDGSLVVKNGTKIEAEKIDCDGSIKVVDGQISADIIKSDGYIYAREIVGDQIRIHSRISRFVKWFNGSFSNVELIEATNIELRGVYAKEVNGEQIIIGPRCEIDRVDCSGTLTIDPTATVKEITGNYKML